MWEAERVHSFSKGHTLDTGPRATRHALILPCHLHVRDSKFRQKYQSFLIIMVVFLLLLAALPGCFSCNAHTVPRNRAKIVEDYVVSAKFDENKHIPQLNAQNQFMEDNPNGQPNVFNIPISSRGNHKDEHVIDDFENRDTLEERDLLVHHHHLPPPHPPPPPLPPPPPVGLAYAPSLFAVGLITFLILLNSLQTSLLLMLKSKGSVVGALGRRKRSVVDVYALGEKFNDSN